MMDPEEIGIVAWGLGGTYAFRVAAIEQKLRAVVVNYGPLSADSFIVSHITAPVLFNMGALDTYTSPDRISKVMAALKIPRRKIDVKIYPNAAYNFKDSRRKNDLGPWTQPMQKSVPYSSCKMGQTPTALQTPRWPAL